MAIDTSNLRREAERIIKIVKNDLMMPSGSLCWERTGNSMMNHEIFSDLGDYMIFLLYFGEAEFVESQIALLKKRLKKYVLVSSFPTKHIKNLVKSYEYTDLLFGLIDYWQAEPGNFARRRLLDCVANNGLRIFKQFKVPKSFYSYDLFFAWPVFDTRDGTFLEIYSDLYNLTLDRAYLDAALRIFETLVCSSFYKKYNLFPDYQFYYGLDNLLTILGYKGRATICKNNTNTLFGLLSLYKTTKDEQIKVVINNVLGEIERRVRPSNGLVPQYIYPTGEIGGAKAFLTASFSLIDFLCDWHVEIGETKHLDLAKLVADFWSDFQSQQTGLFPTFSGGESTFLDSETDMFVALYKLAELLGVAGNKYKKMADLCLEGILKYHGQNDYALSVDCSNGNVVDVTQRTKFLTLFLKAIILKINEEKPIYKNEWLHSLLRDR